MQTLLNAYCWFKSLPRAIKAGMARAIATAAALGISLGTVDAFQQFVQIEGLWKIHAVGWTLYWLVLGLIVWRAKIEWREELLADDIGRSFRRRIW